ncbi:hypothetical protein SAMN05216266_11042 [Amycolatopsis marina]|uniref:Secreted protein n=1 Tax=Amycolatopsis marina TaxID=490629 RepID=A0A1I1APT3_9PSEU|nr:hypothetical protein [Amycolatopsis marina]SFB40055.1 hypothetical protein SAMN05216266_11042 [Amycolatopsis marina]
MNATVAVALITSLSTLAAAALTGMVSAWSNGRQLRHQRLLAREQQAEERGAQRRELRREAYQQFLSQADAAYRVLDEGWLAAPFAGSSRWEAGFTARRGLDEAYIRVQLEGPDRVAAEGANVVRSIGDEFRTHRRVLDANPGTQDCAAELDRAARADVLRARFRTSKDFVAAARDSLGDEPPRELPEA